MKQLYELIENIRDVIAEKIVSSYSLTNTYRATVYAFAFAAIQRIHNKKYELLKPLERKISPLLIATVRKDLVNMIHDLLEHIDLLLASEKPIMVEEANLDHITDMVRYEIGGINHVLVYDCMSIIEQLVVSAFLKAKGISSVFLRTIFINPVGLTRFVTQQLLGTHYRTTLLGLAKYVAKKLNASIYMKSSYIDEKIHEVGLLGIDEFVDKISIDRIAEEVLGKAKIGKTLVFSDHGYDLIASPEEDYIYVTHGFKQSSALGSKPLLLLSRITLFLGAYKVSDN